MTEILIDYRYWFHICFDPFPTKVLVGGLRLLNSQEPCALSRSPGSLIGRESSTDK